MIGQCSSQLIESGDRLITWDGKQTEPFPLYVVNRIVYDHLPYYQDAVQVPVVKLYHKNMCVALPYDVLCTIERPN